ncbi:MAG: tyrosine-type recombinase/integrase [bacterium]|nr:tyrosine-type recombinase/integrase [bacterium]
MRLAEWLDKWYTLYVEASGKAPSTKAMYRNAIDAVPIALGQTPMSDLTAIDVLAWIRTTEAQYPRAAQIDRQMMLVALRVAVKMGMCHPSLADPECIPAVCHTARKAAVLTVDQFHRYIDFAMQSPCAAPLLFCCCGLRRGEALGVRWTDIDLDTGVLTVTQQRQRIKGQYMTRELKSRSAHRALVLPPRLIAYLQTLPRSLSGFVLDVTPDQLYQAHRAVLRAAGIPAVTLHGLRHTVATIAAQTTTITEVQHAMGHAKCAITADLYCNHLLAPCSALASGWA